MARSYKHEGRVIDYTAGADISAGDIVVVGANGEAQIGVALVDIANGESGAVAIEGVFELAKVSGAVIKAGESVMLDVSAASGAGEFDDNQAVPATGDVTGCAIATKDAGNGDTVVEVKLGVGIGTIN